MHTDKLNMTHTNYLQAPAIKAGLLALLELIYANRTNNLLNLC